MTRQSDIALQRQLRERLVAAGHEKPLDIRYIRHENGKHLDAAVFYRGTGLVAVFTTDGQTWSRQSDSAAGLKIVRAAVLMLKNRGIDVLTLATGQVLAVMRGSIELWPSLEAMLAADPNGGFVEREAFFAYNDCYVKDDPHSQAEPEEWQTARFGTLRRTAWLRGLYIRDVYARSNYTVVELACGPALRIDDSGVTYWDSVQELVEATEPKPG